jgi:hypothetical protein
MELKWTDLPFGLQSKLTSSFLARPLVFDWPNGASILESFTKLGYNWPKQPRMREAVFSLFDRLLRPGKFLVPSAFAISISQFGQIGLKWTELPPSLRNSILSHLEKGCERFYLQQFSAILFG